MKYLKKNQYPGRKLLLGMCIAGGTVLLGGCGFFCRIPQDPMGVCAGDRCYIEDYQFVIADKLYAQLGSLLLVERHLCEIEQWRQCEINEAIYRLRKVHSLP